MSGSTILHESSEKSKDFLEVSNPSELDDLLKRFRAIVSARHMSAREISEQTGLNRETASQLKRGKDLRLHPPNVRKIAEFVERVEQESSSVSRGMVREARQHYGPGRVDGLLQLFDSGEMLRRMARHIPPKDLYLMAMDLALELGYSEEELDRIHEWGKQLLKDEKDSG
jgi:transcriptional regulator with XRE-family HTH domain